MNLSGLLPLIKDTAELGTLVQGLGTQRQTVVLVDAARPMLLACLHDAVRLPMIAITPNIESAKRLCEESVAWCSSDTPVLLYPELDVLPYERLTPHLALVQQRLRVLAALAGWVESPAGVPPLVIASAHAVSQKTISLSDFAAARQTLVSGGRFEPKSLMGFLIGAGYEVSGTVEAPGMASRRGGIVDVYSPNNDLPARIEFFGNEVESIRWFDPVTQRSTDLVDRVTIVPAREMLLPEPKHVEAKFAELDLSNCSGQVTDTIREDWELLTKVQWRDGLQFYASLLNGSSILDHLPAEALFVLVEPHNIAVEMEQLDAQAAELRLGQVERGELPRNFPPPYFLWGDLEQRLATLRLGLNLAPWGDETSAATFGFSLARSYAGQLSEFMENVGTDLAAGKRLIIVSQQADRLAELLGENDILASPVSELDHLPPVPSLTLVNGSLGGGWRLDGSTLLTDAEIFGFVKQRRPAPKRRSQHEVFLADLSVGDHVVHVDHGIAVFKGLITMSADGTQREYLILEYSEDDRLYVPTDQVDRVSRYVGSGGSVPSLSRLNTQEWARTKQRVKRATLEMAHELLEIYAAREVSTGITFAPDSLWEQELEASFPYEETPDQFKTIHDVKADMENARPMDRLVCGDVGYGKTEVAIRAAFKAVANGMQVGVLVPTTVLAQQHLITFSQRLAAFPVKVEVLSRFRSAKEQDVILEGLADGSVDICIGTHRLIQTDVVFKNLGLIIIDEEQKFGVGHKERLKKLRSEVDVLTLSATPIPRSLHMSLLGVRDMSTIETAPEERLPIKTYVAEYDEEIVREAILREIDRNGQVFFVHNRVLSIQYVADQLRALVPEARFTVGHGQMPEDHLESAMLDFTNGKYDVLVCTTIIESGLDLPTVNTLIINQSDRLGLTQLYHLRGRVGRGDVRAYAYLLYDKGKRLTETAQQRLKTIFEATELGAGFRIAMKDLEIRGAGNILGPEQSGHVGAVGFDLYCRMLGEAVEELRAGDGRRVSRADLPPVELPLTARIPEDYVTDLNARLALYQRLGRIGSPEEIAEMKQELKDRFGEVPGVVNNLLYTIKIKLLASQGGIRKIFTEDRQVVLTLGSGVRADAAPALRGFGSSVKVGTAQVRLDTRQLGKHWARILEQVLRTMVKK